MQKEDEYGISDFIESVSPLTVLSFQSPINEGNMWSFWSKEDDGCFSSSKLLATPFSIIHLEKKARLHKKTKRDTPYQQSEIKEYIKSAIRSTVHLYSLFCANFLVQFWAPTTNTTGGRSALKTSNQPFGLKRIERGFCEYRKYCMNLEFGTAFQEDDDEFGCGGESIIGRVFMNKQMESTQYVEYYSTKEYPQLEFAVKCGIRRCLALPLFQPNSLECVGVLELVDSGQSRSFPMRLYTIAKNILQLLPLKAPLAFELQIDEGTEDEVVKEMNKLLEVVCTTHLLPFAQIWIPCRPSSYTSYLLCTSTFEIDGMRVYELFSFKRASCNHPLRVGQGVVGKAFLSRKTCFCRDVSQLPIADYPLSHYARECGFTGCFAICLQTTTLTRNHDYVLEFFLPPWNTSSGDQRTFLESILGKVKNNHLQGFEFYLGELGEESFIEIPNVSMHDEEQDSIKISQAIGIQPISKSSLQNNVTGEAVVVDDDDGQNVFGADHNDVILTCLDKRIEILEEKRENEVLIVEQNGVASTSSGRIFCREETTEREYRTDSLSREDLKQHFGKKLDDAADILGVSRSTMKRACRVNGIKKWPSPKRKKVQPSPSNLKHVNKRVGDGPKQIPRFGNNEVPCSNLPPMNTNRIVAHTIPNLLPNQDEGSVTVKATYGDEMIRFQLTFSSRKADLMEKVTLRLPLKGGTFNINYEDDDGDWVLITCDEDLEECIGMSKGKSTIKMLVQPIASEAVVESE